MPLSARSNSAISRRLRSLSIGLLATASVFACSDAEGDPAAALLAVDQRGALDLTMELPTLPGLATDLGVSEVLGPATELWVASWGTGAGSDLAWRADSRRTAAPILAALLSPAEVRAYIGQVSLALELANSLPDEGLPAQLRVAIDEAETHRNEALAHLERGNLEMAIAGMLRSSDVLQAVSPESVAGNMLRRGEEVLRRERDRGTYSLENLDRAERLLQGARQALDEKDPLRAIRRSYYACQLLSVEFH